MKKKKIMQIEQKNNWLDWNKICKTAWIMIALFFVVVIANQCSSFAGQQKDTVVTKQEISTPGTKEILQEPTNFVRAVVSNTFIISILVLIFFIAMTNKIRKTFIISILVLIFFIAMTNKIRKILK